MKSTTHTYKTTVHNPRDSSVESFDSTTRNPLYYIKAFAPYKGLRNQAQPPTYDAISLLSSYKGLHNQAEPPTERVFHTLYYETVDENPSDEDDQPNNLLSLDYKPTRENISFNIDGPSSNDPINIRGLLGFQLNGKFFSVDKAEFNNQNNMEYIKISHAKYHLIFPPKKTEIKIEACMLESPSPVVDKCRIIKKMLKDMIFYDCWGERISNKEGLCIKAGWPHLENRGNQTTPVE